MFNPKINFGGKKMKLEEFLIGTREEMSNNIDKLETVEQEKKYLFKWAGYAIAETTAGCIAMYLGNEGGMGAWNIISVPIMADFFFRFGWTYGAIIKNMPKINEENRGKPFAEILKERLKGVLRPGFVGLAREYLNKK